MWLGHGVGRTLCSRQQRLHVPFLLIFGTVMCDEFHVACIRCLTTEKSWSHPSAAQLFIEKTELYLSKSRSSQIGAQMKSPKSLFFNFFFQTFNVLSNCGPAFLGYRIAVFGFPDTKKVVQRLNLFLSKLFDPIDLLLEFRLHIKINHSFLLCYF